MADERCNVSMRVNPKRLQSALRMTEFRIDVTELITHEKHADLTDAEVVMALLDLAHRWLADTVTEEIKEAVRVAENDGS